MPLHARRIFFTSLRGQAVRTKGRRHYLLVVVAGVRHAQAWVIVANITCLLRLIFLFTVSFLLVETLLSSANLKLLNIAALVGDRAESRAVQI